MAMRNGKFNPSFLSLSSLSAYCLHFSLSRCLRSCANGDGIWTDERTPANVLFSFPFMSTCLCVTKTQVKERERKREGERDKEREREKRERERERKRKRIRPPFLNCSQILIRLGSSSHISFFVTSQLLWLQVTFFF